MQRVLVTGAAGFIGFHVSKKLLDDGWQVFGLDNLSDYYDVKLKENRNSILKKNANYQFQQGFIEDKVCVLSVLQDFKPDAIIHLAAQAGVRYSIDFPSSYVNSNLVGTFSILEAAKKCGVEHLLMASTSSVYGGNSEMPYKEVDKCDLPMSFYAATKKANESMSHSYSHLYNIPVTCLRFFTVYGPWGRPDMALFKFTKAILEGNPIDIFNKGEMVRDFTYIEDLSHAIVKLVPIIPNFDSSSKKSSIDSISDIAPWRVVNIASSNPQKLMSFIEKLEEFLGKQARKNYMEIQPGDVPKTEADISLLIELTGFRPQTSLDIGIKNFVNWYKKYYLDAGRSL
jgi:UDP-glucuronate 4-epimerase